jgi:hypothetical protein
MLSTALICSTFFVFDHTSIRDGAQLCQEGHPLSQQFIKARKILSHVATDSRSNLFTSPRNTASRKHATIFALEHQAHRINPHPFGRLAAAAQVGVFSPVTRVKLESRKLRHFLGNLLSFMALAHIIEALLAHESHWLFAATAGKPSRRQFSGEPGGKETEVAGPAGEDHAPSRNFS